MVKEKKMDTRFQKILQDPRFKKMPKNEKKVKIDSRFSKMFTDDRFHTKTSVDKRGKPMKETTKEDLRKYYDIEEESEKEDNDEEKEHTESKQEVKEKKIDDKGKKKKEKAKKDSQKKEEITDSDDSGEEGTGIDFNDIRGETLEDKNLPDDSSDDDDEEEEEETFEDAEEGIVHGWGELDSEAKRIENAETHRLAICNCDWDRVTANDLFMLLTSFKPTGGIIKSVKIYLSDFGEERLKEEEISGPRELKDTARKQSDDDESDGEETIEGSKYHMEKLREYQLNRLKYYYAVIECSDKETADKIYEECDGMEYEMSGTRLDLRFIPEDMTFDRQPKSIATELPNIKNYQPATFLNTALQQSTVRLTWDETDPKRMENTMRQFTKEDLENMDFKDYIASSSEDEEDVKNKKKKKEKKRSQEGDDEDETEDEEDRIRKYRLLMEEINSKEQREQDENEDMEVTWSLENKASKPKKTDKKEKEDDNDDVTDSEDDIGASEDDFTDGGDGESDGDDAKNEGDDKEDDMMENEDGDEGFNDPFFNQPSGEQIDSDEDTSKNVSKIKKKKKKKGLSKKEEDMTEEERKNKKELELLLIDADDEKKHFSLKGILEQEKLKKKTRKKRKLKKDVVEDDFEFNTKDERFNALYESHLYSIDPSEPNFKKTKATDSIIKEAQKRREERADTRKNNATYVGKKDGKSTEEDTNKAKLSALVKSVKSKTMNHQIQKKKRKLK